MKKIEEESEAATAMSATVPSGPVRRSRLPPPRISTFKGPAPSARMPIDGPSKLHPHIGLQSTFSANQESRPPGWSCRIGSKVRIGGAKTGVLLFYGETHFARGTWCGVKLDEPVGKNDGTVKGVQYFECRPGHGIFAPPDKVAFEEDFPASVTGDEEPKGPRPDWPADGACSGTVATLQAGPSLPPPHLPEDDALDPTYVKSVTSLKRTSESSPSCSRRPLKLRPSCFATSPPHPDVVNATFTISEPLLTRRDTVESAAGSDSGQSAGGDFDQTFMSRPRQGGLCTPFGDAGLNMDLNGTFTVGQTPQYGEALTCMGDSYYAIQEQLDQEGIAGDDGPVPRGRQCSVDLDESLGILTPNEMKDFTVCADIAPAQTPSDEGIQELAEDEVAGELEMMLASSSWSGNRDIFNETFPKGNFTFLSSGAATKSAHPEASAGHGAADDSVLLTPINLNLRCFRPLEAGLSTMVQSLCQSSSGPACNTEPGMLEVGSQLQHGDQVGNGMDDPTSHPGLTEVANFLADPNNSLDLTEVANSLVDLKNSLGHTEVTNSLADPKDCLVTGEHVVRLLAHSPNQPDPNELINPLAGPKAPGAPLGEMVDSFVYAQRFAEERFATYGDELIDPSHCLANCSDKIVSSPPRQDGMTTVLDATKSHKVWLVEMDQELVERLSPSKQRVRILAHSNSHPAPKARFESGLCRISDIRGDPKGVLANGVVGDPKDRLPDSEDPARILGSDLPLNPKDGVTAVTSLNGDCSSATLLGQAGSLSEKRLQARFPNPADGMVPKLEVLLPGVGFDLLKGPDVGPKVTAMLCQHHLSDRPPSGDGASTYTAVDYLIQQMGSGGGVQLATEKQPGMAVSVTSIDTGYQGDAECDLQSEASTNAANTPVDDGQKEFRGAVKPLRDAASDSDFCSDMAASFTDSDLEVDERARGRCARVIDGRLYFGGASKDEVTVSSESLVDDCRARPEAAVQSVLLSKSSLELQYRVSLASVSTIEGSGNYGAIQEDDEAGLDQTMKQEGETPDAVPSRDRPESGGRSRASPETAGGDKKPRQPEVSPKTPKGWAKTLTPSKRETPTLPKPAKSKATPTDRKEASPGSASKKIKTPKKNVMSKIKAMIGATSSKLTSRDPVTGSPNTSAEDAATAKKSSRLPKKNRWDAVMSKIAAGQAEGKSKAKKEVVSKINSNLAVVKSATPTRGATAACPKKQEPTPKPTVQLKPTPRTRNESIASSSNISSRLKGAMGGCDVGDLSLQSRSDSVSQLSSLGPKAQATGKAARPSALPVCRSRTGASRSPSVASTASREGSRGSTLSQLTLASQASTRHPQDASARSMGSNLSVPTDKSVGHGKQISSHGRPSPLPPITQSVTQTKTGAQRGGMGPPSRTLRSAAQRASTEGKRTATRGSQQQQPAMPPAPPCSRRTRGQTTKKPAEAGPRCASATTTTPRTGQETDVRRTSKDQTVQLRSLKSSSGLVQTGPQPDLLHSSGARSTAAREVSRLEALCEARTKELNFMRIQLRHCALGFDSFAVLLQHLTRENESLLLPELGRELRCSQETLQVVRAELEESQATEQHLRQEITELQRFHRQELEQLEEETHARLTQLRHRLTDDHQKDVEALMRCHVKELNINSTNQDEQVETLNRVHLQAIEDLQRQDLQEQKDLKETHGSEIEKLRATHQEEMAALCRQMEDLRGHCEYLERRCKSLEDMLAHDSDYRVQVAANRCNSLEKEVDSLKVVLEMRQSDIQDLRRNSHALQLQAEELELAREENKKLTAKMEDLQAQMQMKISVERLLSHENQQLKNNVEKEVLLSKRLSMEIDELKWRVRQSKEFAFTLSTMEGAAGDNAPDLKGAPPCNLSMYFWDNEGMANGSFSPLKMPAGLRGGPQRGPGSPHASPRLSPSKTSHHSNGSPSSGRPLSTPLCHGRPRRTSTSEDDIPYEGEQVRLREKPRRLRPARSCPASAVDPSRERRSAKPETDVPPSPKVGAEIDQQPITLMTSTPCDSPAPPWPDFDGPRNDWANATFRVAESSVFSRSTTTNLTVAEVDGDAGLVQEMEIARDGDTDDDLLEKNLDLTTQVISELRIQLELSKDRYESGDESGPHAFGNLSPQEAATPQTGPEPPRPQQDFSVGGFETAGDSLLDRSLALRDSVAGRPAIPEPESCSRDCFEPTNQVREIDETGFGATGTGLPAVGDQNALVDDSFPSSDFGFECDNAVVSVEPVTKDSEVGRPTSHQLNREECSRSQMVYFETTDPDDVPARPSTALVPENLSPVQEIAANLGEPAVGRPVTVSQSNPDNTAATGFDGGRLTPVYPNAALDGVNLSVDCFSEAIFEDAVTLMDSAVGRPVETSDDCSIEIVDSELLVQGCAAAAGLRPALDSNAVDPGDDEASRTSSDPLDSFSLGSSSLGGATLLEPSDRGDPPHQSMSPQSQSPKKTTTLVITFRAHALQSVDSSCGSSPVPQFSATPGTASDGSSGDDTASSDSSPRASPELLESSLFGGTRLPRTSAGEAMILDEFAPAGSPLPTDPSHLLLKKALQDQLIHDATSSRCSSMSLQSPGRAAQSLGDSPVPGRSKPDTPESMSQPAAPTADSTNCDVSWSDDDLPSETEV